MNVTPLFPIAIGMDKLPKELSEDQYNFLISQCMRDNTGNKASINAYLLECEELAELHNDLLDIVRKYFKAVYAPADDVDVYITQSWVNSTEPGKFHHVHTHSNSFLSGVFYVHSEAENDKIMFHKPGSDGLAIFLEPTEWNSYNSKTWWYPVATGDVILFPSSLKHEVPTTQSSSNRISLAFNVFLKGNLGNEYRKTQLILRGKNELT